jgi:hypothetical protein
VARFARAWGLGTDGETVPEAVNVAAWGGELGRGRGAVRGIPGVGVGVQNFRISDFQRADIRAVGCERVESAHWRHSCE